MRYVVARLEDGKYLHHSPGTSGSTWTRRLEEARIFDTRDEAAADLCPENEVVIPLDSLLRGGNGR